MSSSEMLTLCTFSVSLALCQQVMGPPYESDVLFKNDLANGCSTTTKICDSCFGSEELKSENFFNLLLHGGGGGGEEHATTTSYPDRGTRRQGEDSSPVATLLC